MIVPIDHAEDPRLDDYRAIRDRGSRRAGTFIGEGRWVVERMLRCPGATRSVLVAPGPSRALAAVAPPDVPVYVASLEVLRATAGFHVHRGVLAVGNRRPFEGLSLDDLVPATDRACIVACEGITNADNMGLLFRNAAAFGVSGVVLDATSHDPLYRRCLRVSIGTSLVVPWARPEDWMAALDRLRSAHGFVLVATAVREEATVLDALAPPARSVLVVGGEGHGLPAPTIEACNHVVRIPMAPGIDSLNVGVAAAVCLHRLCESGRR